MSTPYKARNKRVIMRGGSGKFRKTSLSDLGVSICSKCGKPFAPDYSAAKVGSFVDPMKMQQVKVTCPDCMAQQGEAVDEWGLPIQSA